MVTQNGLNSMDLFPFLQFLPNFPTNSAPSNLAFCIRNEEAGDTNTLSSTKSFSHLWLKPYGGCNFFFHARSKTMQDHPEQNKTIQH